MLLPLYERPSLTIHHGEGCYVTDAAGRRYLDFITGIGVNALGHSHPRIVRAIAHQATRCLHTSNLYSHQYQTPLAHRLCQWSGLSHAFFSNSGTEAMEAALKAALAHGTRLHPTKFHLIALENSFHGRTLGALSITGQPHYRHAFGPLLPGITFVPANDIPQLQAAVTEHTAAIILEPVQGEGGIHLLHESFLREARRLATATNALFIADETQCGLGRTGHYFAYQRFSDILPDIAVTAKPLAAGLPLGATLFNDTAARALPKGQHGSTFGGGPLACRVALEVLEVIEELIPHIRETGDYLHRRLSSLAETRGAGMMAGLQLPSPGAPLVAAALEKGLLINCTQGNVIRLLPPYIATRAHIDEAVQILTAAGLRPRTISPKNHPTPAAKAAPTHSPPPLTDKYVVGDPQ